MSTRTAFNKEFAAARAAGKKNFTFQGKSFNTKVAPTTPKSAPVPTPAPRAKASTGVTTPSPKANTASKRMEGPLPDKKASDSLKSSYVKSKLDPMVSKATAAPKGPRLAPAKSSPLERMSGSPASPKASADLKSAYIKSKLGKK